jgi:predicted Rossmann-fold nucleotide-binding protein
MPVILFGKDFWDRVINFNTLVEEGTISPEDLDLFKYRGDRRRSLGDPIGIQWNCTSGR